MKGLKIGLTSIAVLLLLSPAFAATEAEKQAAIDKGLEYLASQQQPNGRWEYGSDDGSDLGATGSALLAFLEEGYVAGTSVVFNGTDYGDVVGDGLNYILGKAQVVSISPQAAGNPDGGFANGVGVKFNYTASNNNRDTYATGLVLPAIASTGTPNKLVTTGPLVGRVDGTGAGGAWTYKDVVQNTVDYFAYGQNDSGWAEGGWRYYANYGSSDNSTAQWPAIAMLFATQMGVTAPAFVKSELRTWMDYIQNPADGGSYYDNNFGGWGSNMSRTGGWLAEAAFAGTGPGGLGGGSVTAADITAALNYVDSNWNTYANSTWNGNFGHAYAMWSVYKGLEANIGLGNTTVITPRAQGGAVIDPGDVWNWYEDYCEYLVSTQAASGAWGNYVYWGGPLAAAWYINILNATQIPQEVVPLPGAAFMGFALLGGLILVRRVRRRRA